MLRKILLNQHEKNFHLIGIFFGVVKIKLQVCAVLI